MFESGLVNLYRISFTSVLKFCILKDSAQQIGVFIYWNFGPANLLNSVYNDPWGPSLAVD